MKNRRYLKPSRRTDEPIQHMVCSECGEAALMEYWDWCDVDHDRLICPHCRQESQIGQWIEGLPEHQPCLMCGGSGVSSG